ncbi:MAG: adenosylcobinamide-GDP ribazoletransferase [Rhodobacteraceae bacterium]|nr:adenosylcobinamide-GDP ribazoletransferase [Paracoccaceae bacterium]MCF8516511.1 adenosylcobinamide-GDP ribazoletransferase [Paracoccaceae bacterium]MCF8520821.1 adenosylcobinamide-GDP ribazoletransferase [Paracoccaceae bacterium]
MPERDTATKGQGTQGWFGFLFNDICSAFGLLTRLPAPQASVHRPDAAWCWPLVGLVTGAIAAFTGWVAQSIGLPQGVAAASVLVASALCTGALHEDGLADSADGLFGGWTKDRRLEIMKDSHIGTYGTLALLLTGLAKWSAISGLLATGSYGALIAAAVMSRAPMAVIMAMLPNVRGEGLSQSVGRPSMRAALGAVLLAVALCLPFGSMTILMIIAGGLAAVLVALIARVRIGGQTGDVLGAAQQLAELAAVCVAIAYLA